MSEPIAVIGLEGEIVRTTPIRLGLVGCGAHAYRNVLPPLRQIPAARMTSFCDHNVSKAELYAKAVGFEATWHGSVSEMLDAEELDAVLVVVGFDDDTGAPLYPEVAGPILRRGLPVWMEKPPARDARGVEALMEAAAAGETFAQVGFKKVFSPAVERSRQLVELAEFGAPTQYTYTYDVDLPLRVGDLRAPDGRRFLDDFVHVASVIDYLVGTPSQVQTIRGPTGAGVIVTRHANGVVGSINLSRLTSGLAPVERLELVGTGANLTLENGAMLRYFPPGTRGAYGTSTSYLPPLDDSSPADFGPRIWEPEFSLGNLHGGTHFIQGYYQQMRQFVDAVHRRRPPIRGGLDAALGVMRFIDALVGDFGVWRTVASQPTVEVVHITDALKRMACPQCDQPMTLKDGWNYVCRSCGKTRAGFGI